MRKSELEDMIDNLKNQVTQLERDRGDLYNRLNAMAECLNLEYVPEKTIKSKYKKNNRGIK